MDDAMTTIAARIDDIGKPAWIALTVLGLIFFWPLGLLLLGYLIGSGRMGCWGPHSAERWQHKMDRMQRRMQEKMQRMQGGGGFWGGPAYSQSSGNRAFDDYRAETLRRLEEEQREFREFLDRLRQAKDKAEFDQFMAERRRSEGPATHAQI
jgi:hypothetical protein